MALILAKIQGSMDDDDPNKKPINYAINRNGDIKSSCGYGDRAFVRLEERADYGYMGGWSCDQLESLGIVMMVVEEDFEVEWEDVCDDLGFNLDTFWYGYGLGRQQPSGQ